MPNTAGGSIDWVLKRFRFVLEHPELWDDIGALFLAMKAANHYSCSTTYNDLRFSMAKLIANARAWKQEGVPCST